MLISNAKYASMLIFASQNGPKRCKFPNSTCPEDIFSAKNLPPG